MLVSCGGGQRCGEILGRYVMYRGEDAVEDAFTYKKVEKYLKEHLRLPETITIKTRPLLQREI